MKRIITLAFTMTALSLNLFAWPIIQVNRSGWFPLYSNVNQSTDQYQVGNTTMLGITLDCSGFGLRRCRPINQGYVLDPNDATWGLALYDLAEEAIDNGQANGSSQQRVRVSGESFERVYTVTWTTSLTGVEIIVDRTDV